jgi:hypothetical protein
MHLPLVIAKVGTAQFSQKVVSQMTKFNYGSYLYLCNYIWVYKQETIAMLLYINYSIHFTMCSVMCHTRVKNYDKLVTQ